MINRSQCSLNTVRIVSTFRWLAIVLVFLTVAPSALPAQTVGPQMAGPNTIVGIVTDTLDVPLADVDVFITQLRLRARTRPDGTFRFDNVVRGSYEVSARSIGLVASAQRVVVGNDGGTVTIRMIRFRTFLPTMLTTESRGGLSGIIGDTAYRAMENVRVTVGGAGPSARTDSTGAFFVPLNPGDYMVRLEVDGYARQLIGISIPATGGQRLAAWMVPQDEAAGFAEAQMLFDLDQRLIRERGAGTRFISGAALLKQGVPDLAAYTRRYATGQTKDCWVYINGTRDSLPLWTLTAKDLEFVELYYPPVTARPTVTSIGGHKAMSKPTTSLRPGATASCGNLALVAWLKK